MIQALLPDWAIVLLPAVVALATALAVFVADTVDPDSENHALVAGIAIAGTLSALALAAWYLLVGVGDSAVTVLADQLVVDRTSLLFTVLVTAVTSLVLFASYDYLRTVPRKGEFYSLTLLAATGMITMAHANSLVTVFVALELSSLPSYALVAFLKRNRGSVEAGLKYFLIGALSSAIFAYGISLVYAVTGTLLLEGIRESIAGSVDPVGVLGIGVLMMVVGFGFKVAGVPFHFWAPEAYEGAPAPVSALLSSASKAAGFVIAFRVFLWAFPLETMQSLGIDWGMVFAALAVVTMLLGNFAAAVQTNVKRMLAYSSIGHAGYVLIALGALTQGGQHNELVLAAGMMHLLVYAFMNTGAFLFVGLAEYWGVGRTFEDYAGLANRAPIASAAVTLLLFNLAGLPIGGGFWSKYVLFTGAIGNGYWWLAAVGALGSAISLYYYARLVKALWLDEPNGTHDLDGQPVGIYVALVTAAVVTAALLLGFGLVSGEALGAAEALLG